MIRMRRPTLTAAVPSVPVNGEELSQAVDDPGPAGAAEPQQPAAPRSRRAMMTGTVAAGAGAAAALVLRAQPANAADGGTFVLGAANSASQATSLTNDGADNATLDGLDVSAAQGNGVQGTTSADNMSGLAGVDNSPDGGAGVTGTSTRGAGVVGNSQEGAGVQASSTDGPGVTASSTNGFGVTGSSSVASGVFGTTTNSGQGGVFGFDTCPTGANGVMGTSNLGTGVLGTSTSGIGVLATSTSGTALQVEGKASFSRSGVASVPAGQKSVTVTLAGVTARSLVLVTLQKLNPTGAVSVLAAVPGTGSFTIYLSGPSRVALPAAWIVLDPPQPGFPSRTAHPRIPATPHQRKQRPPIIPKTPATPHRKQRPPIIPTPPPSARHPSR